MDITHITLQDVIDTLNQQASGNAKVVYDSTKNTIRIYYDTRTDYGTDAVLESKKWQDGGKVRPILSHDGIVLFPYGEQEMQVVCEPLQLCDLSLEPGEYITSGPIIGDKERWILNDAVSKENNLTVQHLVITPQDAGLNTSLLIPTNKRTYMIKLRSSTFGYVARVGFYYPKDFNLNLKKEEEKQKEEKIARTFQENESGGLPEELDFNYELSGDEVSWKPLRVFSDGHRTFIQMPPNLSSRDLPALIILGNDGTTEDTANFSVKNNYYIIEKIFDKALLTFGNNNDRDKVIITHVPLKKGFWAKVFG